MRSPRVLLFVATLVVCLQVAYSFQDRAAAGVVNVVEAPTGFDNQTNGFIDQTTFDADRQTFDEQEGIADGLGPLYNARSCGECHSNPVLGGSSQVTELRAGHYDSAYFYDHPGGSLINDRAIDALIQERLFSGYEVRTLRLSSSTLGLGFIEAIDDNTLLDIARNQPIISAGRIAGDAIRVPVGESQNARRIGRFGWKCQHGSLISFAADAYLNEMGITSPLQPNENTSNGVSVADYDTVADPENDGEDVEKFAEFMRATKAPSRDTQLANTADALVGAQLFQQTGCSVCHVSTIVTARTGSAINGGKFRIPASLGDKIIHPFSDFLLHDVGTGDGIVQNGGQSTRNKLRTAPLWGLRTRTRLMHDGVSVTFHDAIMRHAGEATFVIDNYRALTNSQKNQLLDFLRSL
jgi:CxxC motif-containing protein (DUF1111 family)